jgi:hypothetical protein
MTGAADRWISVDCVSEPRDDDEIVDVADYGITLSMLIAHSGSNAVSCYDELSYAAAGD